jgi:signal transduction histidine kinase
VTPREVFQHFAVSPGIPAVVVLDAQGALSGLISRRRFMEIFSQPYRTEVYFSRPLATLLIEEFQAPLCVSAQESIDVAAQAALSRERELFYEPLAVASDDGRFTVLEAQELLHALANQYKYQFRELQVAKDSLVQSEKLASLGALVAGVAHEINTPIGVSLSAASYLADEIETFEKKLAANQVRKVDLADLVDNTKAGSAIILQNMERAATLVKSFKQVAADQTSELRRVFDLKQSIGEIFFSLEPSLKRTAVKLEFDVPESIEMDSFPGALAQIMSNLVLNALVHAFESEAQGSIHIKANTVAHSDEVKLVLQDDGVGISPDNVTRIFDPFFTTRRNQGGTGLGLHIVHNLVYKTLGGSIKVFSQPNEGTRFEMRVPRVAPVQVRPG